MNIINTKENISRSIVCNWKISKYKPPLNNYNIISVCFFRQLNTSDLDNDRYIKGIIKLSKTFYKILRDYRLRIYYDKSTEDIIKKNIIQSDKIELYYYDIPIFKDDNIYHKKLLGTMIRFLPLYNYPLHKVDECIIFDIDDNIYYIYNKIVKLLRKNKIKIAHRYRSCYINKRITCLHNKYPAIANFIYQSISLPTRTMAHFLEKVYIKNDIKLNKLITKCSLEDKYSYGIDEIFINKYHMRYFYKNKIPILLVLFDRYSFSKGLIRYLDYISDKNTLIEYYNYIKNLLKIMDIKIDIIYKDIESFKENIILELQINNQIINEYLSTNNLSNIENYIKTNKQYKYLSNCLLQNLKIKSNRINYIKLETDWKSKKVITKLTRFDTFK